MIENERQYHVTKKRMAQFEASLASLHATPRPDHVPPRLHQAMQESVASQLADLRHEMAEYEALKARQSGCISNHNSFSAMKPRAITPSAFGVSWRLPVLWMWIYPKRYDSSSKHRSVLLKVE